MNIKKSNRRKNRLASAEKLLRKASKSALPTLKQEIDDFLGPEYKKKLKLTNVDNPLNLGGFGIMP